jgi:hypothetical protein
MKNDARRFLLFLLVFYSASATVKASDSSQTDWSIRDADCQPTVLAHRMTSDPEGIKPCEQIQILAHTGTFCHACQSLEAARAIEDLHLFVSMLATHGGVQLLARVVFPHTRDEQTGQSITTLVRGGAYTRVGAWQELEIDDLPKKIDVQSSLLRLQHGSDIDLREAFVDQLVLNIYGGPGTTNVWIGPTRIVGAVGLEAVSTAVDTDPHELESAGSPDEPSIQIVGNVLRVDGRPFLPQVIEHSGEPLDFLARLGFNTVAFDSLPSAADRESAKRWGLWIVCPLPTAADQLMADDLSHILAWYAGPAAVTNKTIGSPPAKTADTPFPSFTRPTVACVRDGVTSDETADLLLLDGHLSDPPPDLWTFHERLQTRIGRLAAGAIFWARVPTQTIDGQNRLEPAVSFGPESMRQFVYSSIALGARGVWFQSHSRLDNNDPATKMRRAILEHANLQLRCLRPWAVAGIGGTDVRNGYVQRSTERAHLLLPIPPSRSSSRAIGSHSESIVVNGVPESSYAFVVLPMGLKPIATRRTVGGIQVMVRHDLPPVPIIVASSSQIISWLHRHVSSGRHSAVKLEVELVRAQLELLSETIARLDANDAERIGELKNCLSRLSDDISTADAYVKSNDLSRAMAQAAKVRAALATTKIRRNYLSGE